MRVKQILLIVLLCSANSLLGNQKIDSLLTLVKIEKNDTVKIKNYIDIGYLYERINLDSAIYYYNKVIELSETKEASNIDYLVVQKRKAEALYNLGFVYTMKNQNQISIELLNRSISTNRIIGDSNSVGKCYHVIGRINWNMGELDKSLKAYKKALRVFTFTNFKRGIAACYSNIGVLYNEKGYFNKSLESYIKALEIAEETNDLQSASICRINIGNIYFYQDDFLKAISFHNKALQYYLNTDFMINIAQCYNNLGICYYKLDSTKVSLDYYKKALAILDQTEDAITKSYTYNGLAELYFQENDFKKAKMYNQKALKMRKELGDKNGIAISSVNLASTLIELKEYRNVTKLLLDAEVFAKEENSLSILQSVYEAMAIYYKEKGDYKKAYLYQSLDRQYRDSIFSKEKIKQINELETKYQTEKKDREIELLQKDNEIQNQKLKTQRLLIIIIVIGAMLVLLLWFVFYRMKQIRHKNRQNELELKSLKNEQRMLRSQMNPHFIYNSLNSIQAFISSDESYQAEKYLAQFAKLMRGILEHSRTEFIELDKEIEILNLYLSLEQLRFENRFKFIIEVDNEMESDFVSIPPMLVQPFAENAILHAFKGKTDGCLTITFTEQNDYLVCTIDDNGIGRKASSNVKEKKHKSMATTITQERLDTLSTELNKKAYFTIEDKIENNKSKGTTVFIHIPVIE